MSDQVPISVDGNEFFAGPGTTTTVTRGDGTAILLVWLAREDDPPDSTAERMALWLGERGCSLDQKDLVALIHIAYNRDLDPEYVAPGA